MQITKESAERILKALTNTGHKDNLTYIVTKDGDSHTCYLRCAVHNVFEYPEGKNTYWDSLRHGISWKSKEDILNAITKAYELMDHKIGQKEEWHAQPQNFENGVLLENLKQPGYGLEHTQYNNGTQLIGYEGRYGLRINVGGWCWRDGVNPKAVEECAMLERVSR